MLSGEILPTALRPGQDDYGPDYKRWMDAHKTLNDCKKVRDSAIAQEVGNGMWVRKPGRYHISRF